jgi:beta-lactam-binding protein with PASTA domain
MKFNFIKIINSCLEIIWILPFIAFCIGYFSLQFFIADNIVQAPDLVGKDILHATKMSSIKKLNLRIIGEKEVADAIPGTIIKQNPLPHKLIKTHQSIFIVITKLPTPMVAPMFINKNQLQIEAICKEKNIKNRVYLLPANYPIGQCFAQIPSADQPLESKKMSSYISMGNPILYLFPDFTGIDLQEVLIFLEAYNISYDIFYKDQKISIPLKQNFTVLYQKPLAGTLVVPNNKLYVQLQVSSTP